MTSKGGKGEGRDPRGQHGPGAHDEKKVIRLPRDWLGPREELVPFGPSADRPGDEPLGSEPPSAEHDAPPHDLAARPPLEEVASPPADPVSPDDFWGERSAALQGPLDEAERDAALADESGPAWRQRRGPVLAAVAAVLAAGVVLTLSLLGQSSNPEKPKVSAGMDTGGGRGILWPLPAHPAPALHRAGWSPHVRQRPKKATVAHGGGSVAVNYVRQPSQAGSATSGGPGTAGAGSTSATSVTSSTPSSVDAPAPSSSSGSSTTSSGTGSRTPTGASGGSRRQPRAPAFGAGGALGPGHSRTG